MEEVKRRPARSYGQYCGLARALDAVGDRWSLLIVRELLPGPMRYSELVASLGGIATNLLADRLRSLESSGVIERRPGQTSGVVYALTPWGNQLRDAIDPLIRWSTPLMASGQGGDAFPASLACCRARSAAQRKDGKASVAEPASKLPVCFVTLRIGNDGPHATVQPERRPDTILKAEPEGGPRTRRRRDHRRRSAVPERASTATGASSPRCWARRRHERAARRGPHRPWRPRTVARRDRPHRPRPLRRSPALALPRKPNGERDRAGASWQNSTPSSTASHKRTSKRCSIEATYGSRPAMAN